MEHNLSSKLAITDLYNIVPDLVDVFEAASNRAEDIEHEIDGLLVQVRTLQSHLSRAKASRTRAWNRMIEAANKTVAQ